MTRLLLPLCLVAWLLVSWIIPARATVGPDIHVRIIPVDPDEFPQIGVTWSGEIEFEAGSPRQVSETVLRAPPSDIGEPGWEIVDLEMPSEFSLEPGVPLRFEFTISCTDPTEPILLDYLVDGAWTAHKTWYLLPQGSQATLGGTNLFGGSDVVKLNEFPESMEPNADFPLMPLAPPEREFDDLRDNQPKPGKKGYHIRVHGSFNYTDRDGRVRGAYGATVRIYDEDDNPDDLMAAASLPPNGAFDFMIWWDQSERPDIYLELKAKNAKVDMVHPNVWENTWVWETGVLDNFEGVDVNYGALGPGNAAHNPCFHSLATISRAWIWYEQRGFGELDPVDVWWPSSDHPHFTPGFNHIHINAERQWLEKTMLHEYGHAWMHQYSEYGGTDYCGGWPGCVKADGGCSHCKWCTESSPDAIREGVPQWLPHTILASDVWTGVPITDTPENYLVEYIQECDPGVLGDQLRTEGIFAALLRDLEDSDNENDSAFGTAGRDWLTAGDFPILQIFDLDKPQSVMEFLGDFVARVGPDPFDFWSTVMNNGINLDDTPPGAAWNLLSTSHIPGESSPNVIIGFWWREAPDNAAGVKSYSVDLWPSPHLPDATIDVTGDTWSSPTLSPGVYHFNIRAVDRAGNWSNEYATLGPFTIREPTPADLVPQGRVDLLSSCVVPRTAPDAANCSAPDPLVLHGNEFNTYLNMMVRNLGESPTNGHEDIEVTLDGERIWLWEIPQPLPGLSVSCQYNKGPFRVQGGRHTFAMFADINGELHEENGENNNKGTSRWVWRPRTINGSTPAAFEPPPHPTADAWITLPFSSNCDGLRFQLDGAEFGGVFAWADREDLDDFDLRLHEPSGGAKDGFEVSDLQVASYAPLGSLDAVLVRKGLNEGDMWDVGVVNFEDVPGYYWAQRLLSEDLGVSKDVAITLPKGEHARLYHLDYSGNPSPHHITIRLEHDPAIGNFHLLLHDWNSNFMRLGNGLLEATTDESGVAEISFQPRMATYALVVYREPLNAALITVSLDLSTHVTPVDAATITPSGWYAPLVPRALPNGTPTSVPAPLDLAGEQPSTYLNMAFWNGGPMPLPPFRLQESVDGVPVADQLYSSGLNPWQGGTINLAEPITVLGGRHTLSLELDWDERFTEWFEDNNTYGRQWNWTPPAMTRFAALRRPAPPEPTGGWDHIVDATSPLIYNCDGLRALRPAIVGRDGFWQVVAAMPGESSDVDLRLHNAAPNAWYGFDEMLAVSAWPQGALDYVLTNFRATEKRDLDVGVIRVVGEEDYFVQLAGSDYLGRNPTGSYGPFVISAGNLINLHEIELQEMHYSVTLAEITQNVDLGFTLHRANVPYHSRLPQWYDLSSWMGTPGEGEHLLFTVPQAGAYCLAVWKTSASETPKSASYDLIFRVLTDAPPVEPVIMATRIANVAPNPFNPRTTIDFDMDAAGPARLLIYDSSGRKIRTLLNAHTNYGRHSMLWDGRDDTGRSVSSGVYYVRLSTDRTTDNRKVLLLK